MTPQGSPDVVAGRRAVTEAIRAGSVLEVLAAEGARQTQGLRDLFRAASEADVRVREVPRIELDELADDHQGVAALVHPGVARALSDRELSAHGWGEADLVVILDGITDPQNLGAAARTAEAAGAVMLISRIKRAADVTPAAVRASAGALLHLPHARVTNITRTIGLLQSKGFTVVGLDDAAGKDVFAERCPQGRVGIVVGSEGEGMSRLVRESCDVLVSIPMRGKVSSLNASASLAAALYAFVLPRDG